MLLKEPIAILADIGGGTADPIVLQYGVPQPFEDENPARGVIWTYHRIRSDIKAKFGVDLSEEAVNMFLTGENVRITEQAAAIIRDHMTRYANRVFMELREKGLPFSAAYTVVQGGGAGRHMEAAAFIGAVKARYKNALIIPFNSRLPAALPMVWPRPTASCRRTCSVRKQKAGSRNLLARAWRIFHKKDYARQRE